MSCQCNSDGAIQLQSGDYWQNGEEAVFAIGMIHGQFYGANVEDRDDVRQFSRDGRCGELWGYEDSDLVKKVYYTVPVCPSCHLSVGVR